MKCVSLLVVVFAACSQAPIDGSSSDAPVAERAAPLVKKKMLPNWATPEELQAQRDVSAPQTHESVAPGEGFRVPAEFEPVQAVMMTWAGSEDMLTEISVAAVAAGANVWMVGGPSSLSGVAADHYRALDYAFDSIWARDYGPTGIDEATQTLGIVDSTYRHYAARRNDDAVPCHLASTLGAPCHSTALILDGGNYMTDGKGNVFLSRRVYEWNSAMSKAQVDTQLKTYFGGSTIHILDYAANGGEPADGTGHMDMFAKLLGECKVLVAETTEQPYKASTEKAAAYFAALDCAPGKKYEVSRTKSWTNGGTWYTYTNSLIVNKTVIVPFYDDADNEAAAQVYKDALPGYTVVGVNSEGTISMGGSIHCISKEIPAL